MNPSWLGKHKIYIGCSMYCNHLCLNIFHLLARKSKLEKFTIYSNKFFHSFHLSESSFTCPQFWASGLVRRLSVQRFSENLEFYTLSLLSKTHRIPCLVKTVWKLHTLYQESLLMAFLHSLVSVIDSIQSNMSIMSPLLSSHLY